VASGPDPESVLRLAEKIGTRLEPLIDTGVIAGFESPARYLPSLETQRERKESLPPAAELRERLQKAVIGLPIHPERLEPFLQDVEVASAAPPLTRADLQGTSLAAAYDATIVQAEGRWNALLPLKATPVAPTSAAGAASAFIDVTKVRNAVADVAPGQIIVLDLKNEADKLYSTYLGEAVRLSLAGFAAIVILLMLALRSFVRVVRLVLPLALAVLAVAGGLVLVGHQLTLLHVIGMLLIIAVGSNYALFFDRRSSDPLTLASLLIANAATVVSFGVLAFSHVPVLAALGSSVAPGAGLALIFSAMLARPASA
jgi:predicted exporter